jgi:hypothetical protein
MAMIAGPLLSKVCLGLAVFLGLASLRPSLFAPPPYRDG